ncbi:hypothetical protein CEXT_466511, partial [Caerostris extrusa]
MKRIWDRVRESVGGRSIVYVVSRRQSQHVLSHYLKRSLE